MQLESHSENAIPGNAKGYIPDEYFEFKTRIHDRLLDLMDLSLIERLTREDLEAQIKKLVGQIIIADPGRIPLNHDERQRRTRRSAGNRL